METASLLRAGDVIGGFRIDDVIGIGGMAIVYRAEQVSLGRPVALKVLSSKLTSDLVFQERFRREGTHAASLEHPNIVPVYDSGEEGGHLYLAMRLVEGTNLAELIQSRGVTADQAIEILRPIASALDTAHAAGLIHRDVKPQNILLTSQGHPYLADFGVAKGSNTYGLTATGGFVGSVNYASPEQIKGLTLTSASDVYALTAVLYQCLTGHVPYPRETDAGVMHAQLNEPPPTLPTIGGADSDFHTVFARGMAKDPGARYGHAGDLINAAALSVSRLPSEMRKAVPAFPLKATSGNASAESGASADGEELLASGDGEELGESSRAASVPDVGALTAVDQRREPVAAPTPEARSSKRRWPLIVTAIGGAVALIAAAIALLSAGGGTKSETAKHGFIRLTYAKPWHETAASAADAYGLRFADELGLSASGSSLTAGTLADGGAVPGSLPPELRHELDEAPRESTVKIGSAIASRYEASAQKGAIHIGMLVIATVRGDLGLLCAGRTLASLRSCLTIAQTARVVGVQSVPPGADPRLLHGLSETLAANVAARSHQRGLDSLTPAARAAAARRISSADSRAAHSLAVLSPEPRDREALGTLVSALRGEASALSAFAVIVHKRSQSTYKKAADRVHAADRSLASSEAKLRAIGFTGLPALGGLKLPPPPAPRHRRTPPSTGNSAAATSVESPAVEPAPTPAPPASEPAPEPAPAPTPQPSAPTPSHSERPKTVVSAPK